MYDWTDDDVEALNAACVALGIEDVTIPLKVWSNESGLNPQAHNRFGDAAGIFQVMPATAKSLGWDVDADPHLDAFRALSAAEQLRWAVKYYSVERAFLGSVAAFYCVTFLPAMAHAVLRDSTTVVCGLRGPYAWAYTSNPGFDTAKKGSITGNDLAAAAERAYGPLGQSLAVRVAALG